MSLHDGGKRHRDIQPRLDDEYGFRKSQRVGGSGSAERDIANRARRAGNSVDDILRTIFHVHNLRVPRILPVQQVFAQGRECSRTRGTFNDLIF
jgi:hypothetical protein